MLDSVHPGVTDPQAREHLEWLFAQTGAVPSRETDDAALTVADRLQALRTNPTWRRLPDDGNVETADTEVPAGGAGPALGARLYAARAAPPIGTLVFAHGGGWVAGDLDANDALCRALAAATGAQVLSIDYRLAPEHPFPAAVDDLTRALAFAATGAGGLVGDTAAVGVAGHSSGGNLAAAVALRARAGEAPTVRCQVLLCPVLDDVDASRKSHREYTWGLPLTSQGMQWYWQQYAPDAGSRRIPDASPLRAPDLTGSAPAVIVAAEADPLRDEALEYATRLIAAGVPTLRVERSGVPHLFLTFPGMTSRDEVLAEIAPFVRGALGG